jgi:hypothetical protein
MAVMPHRTPEQRLSDEAEAKRKEAEKLPHGPKRDALLKEASRLETASNAQNWASSTGLQPPEGR